MEKQKEMLGSFFKDNIKLPIFPEKDEIAMTYYAFTFAESDSNTFYDENKKGIITMLGVSGVGKTHSLFMRAVQKKCYLIYITGKMKASIQESIPDYRQPNDLSYHIYLTGIKDLIMKYDDAEKLTSNAICLTHCFIFARLLHLKRLLELNSYITPKEFLLSQLNGSSKAIASFVLECLQILKKMDSYKVLSMLKSLRDEIKKKINISIEVAVDEASIIAKQFESKFLSPNKKCRSLLTIFGQCLREQYDMGIFDKVFFAGTGLSLCDNELIASSLQMTTKDHEYYPFEMNHKIDEVWRDLSRCLDLSGCEDLKNDASLMLKIVGRKRLFSLVVRNLSALKMKKNNHNKKAILKRVIENVYETTRDEIVERLITSYNNSANSLKKDMLVSVEKFICAHFLTNGKIRTSMKFDFLDLAIAQPVKIVNDKYCHYEIKEYLATDACIKFYQRLNHFLYAPLLDKFVSLLHEVVTTMGAKTTVKGNVFELLVGAQLMVYNGTKWSDLPFIENNIAEKMPWLSDLVLNIERMGTAESFECKNDEDVIESVVNGKEGSTLLLICCPDMGPDLLLISKQNSKLYFMVFGLKFYTKIIPRLMAEKNTRTTDLSKVYYTKKGKVNTKREEQHKRFHDLFQGQLRQSVSNLNANNTTYQNKKLPVGGIIRIKIELPESNLYANDSTNGFQANIRLNKNNIDRFINDERALNLIQSIVYRKDDLMSDEDEEEIGYLEIDDDSDNNMSDFME
jgi:hypothetical protein